MSLIEKLTDYLISRRLKKHKINVNYHDVSPSAEFKRVLNTLRENKIMVDTREDGIYIRMAGNKNKSECFSLEWAKVKSFDYVVNDLKVEEFSFSKEGYQYVTNKEVSQKIYEILKQKIDSNSKVVIDLKGVKWMSVECASIIFGQLHDTLGNFYFSKVEFKNKNYDFKVVIQEGIKEYILFKNKFN